MGRTYEEIVFAIENKLFTSFKPIEKPNPTQQARIKQLELAGRLMIQHKDDGNGILSLVGNKPTDIRLFTLGLNDDSIRHAHIVQAMYTIMLPPRSIISGEISRVVNGKQDRYTIRIKDERNKEFANSGSPSGMSFFSAIAWEGEDTSDWTNWDKYFCIAEHMKKYPKIDFVRITELLQMSLAEAREHAEKNRWEGLVLYDMDGKSPFAITEPGQERIKEIRPEGIYKDKKDNELDFVAYAYEPSTAKSWPGAVRDFWIGLIEPSTGLIIPVCKCGGGMKVQDRKKYADADLLPVAVEVKFEKWSDNGALLHPSLLGIRDTDNKTWQQCIATPEQLETVLAVTKERIDPHTVERIIPRKKVKKSKVAKKVVKTKKPKTTT